MLLREKSFRNLGRGREVEGGRINRKYKFRKPIDKSRYQFLLKNFLVHVSFDNYSKITGQTKRKFSTDYKITFCI